MVINPSRPFSFCSDVRKFFIKKGVSWFFNRFLCLGSLVQLEFFVLISVFLWIVVFSGFPCFWSFFFPSKMTEKNKTTIFSFCFFVIVGELFSNFYFARLERKSKINVRHQKKRHTHFLLLWGTSNKVCFCGDWEKEKTEPASNALFDFLLFNLNKQKNSKTCNFFVQKKTTTKVWHKKEVLQHF